MTCACSIVLRWCWLPCISTYPLHASPSMHRLHNPLCALHHTGSQTENPVVITEEPEEQLEVQQQEVPEADEEDVEELPECPDHRPSSFERGKPRSIFLSVCNDFIKYFTLNWCITFRNCLQPLLHYTLFTFVILHPCYPVIRSRVNA